MPRSPLPLHKKQSIGIAMDALKLDARALAKGFVDAANAGHPSALRFLDGLLAGASDAFLRQVDDAIKGYQDVRSPHLVLRERQWRWHPGIRPPEGATNDDWAYGLVIARIVNDKLERHVRRCDVPVPFADQIAAATKGELPRCGRLFFGDPRRRYCSAGCGSRMRVAAKRERDQKRPTKRPTKRRSK